MNYSPSDIKRKHALRAAIRHLQATSEVCWWLTFTFVQNLTDREGAGKLWRKFAMRIQREYPCVRAVGVWARQRRGAWHIHLVMAIPGVEDLDCEGDKYTGVGGSANWRWLRNNAISCGFGIQLAFRRVGGTDTDGHKLANYVGNYCTDKNGLDPVRDKNVRRLIYLGKDVRIYDMKWVSTFKRVVRLGRDEDKNINYGEDYNGERIRPSKKKASETWPMWYARCVGTWFVIGWHSLTQAEQEVMLTEDTFTKRYLATGQKAYV